MMTKDKTPKQTLRELEAELFRKQHPHRAKVLAFIAKLIVGIGYTIFWFLAITVAAWMLKGAFRFWGIL